MDRYISDNFIWIFLVGVILVSGFVAFIVIKKRKNLVLIKNVTLKTAMEVSYHPFKAFDELKYKNQGSVKIALVLLALFYFAIGLLETASGFLYKRTEPSTYNTLYTLISTAGLVLLWSVSNWLIASLFSGKGRFKEVFTATCYSLIPLILYTLVSFVLSHILSLSGLEVMDSIHLVVIIFTFFIMAIAIMTVHEYDFFKFLSTSLVTLFFMILIVFVIFLVGVLLQQVGELISSVYREVFYR